jgi:uncharacterized protein (DUF736 family)
LGFHTAWTRRVQWRPSAPSPRQAKFVGPEKDNDKASDYRIFSGVTEFGAPWKKTARDSDREYLSVKLDDPSFPAPIYASLLKVDGEEGFTVIWSRRTGE